MEGRKIEHWPIQKLTKEGIEEFEDTIATEFPLTIILNGHEFATMLCTPTHIEDLVIGFLAGEGVIRVHDEIKSLTVNESKGFVYVELNRQIEFDQKAYAKRFIGSCCGKSRQFYFQNDVKTARTIMTKTRVSFKQCLSLMDALQSQSQAFNITGGVHNAALADEDGLLVTRIDIGRHNTLDKLFGYSLKNKMNLKDKMIVFSGRISSEVLLKVAKMGVGILLSKSAPTDLALKLAEDLEITTIGFIRGESMNIYTHPHRIISD